MFDFLNGPYVVPKKSDKMIYIHIKHVHVKFQRGNTIFKPIIIAKHIS